MAAGMAEEAVVYAELRGVPGTPGTGRSPRRCPRSPGLALAGGLLLGAAIGALGALGFGRPPAPAPPPPAAPCPRGGCNGSAAELAAALRGGLCPGGAGGGPCGLCPPGWTPRGGSCYLLSAVARGWDGAARDCAARGGALVAPPHLEEAGSLEGLARDPNPVWLGLRFSPRSRAWLWPDGSQQPPPPGQRGGQGRDCGVLRRGRTALESCGAELRWLCRRDALLL